MNVLCTVLRVLQTPFFILCSVDLLFVLLTAGSKTNSNASHLNHRLPKTLMNRLNKAEIFSSKEITLIQNIVQCAST